MFVLIGWGAANNHGVLCSWARYSWADDMVQVAKNEMWGALLVYNLALYCLLERSNNLRTHTPAFIECFWLGSVRSTSS